MEKSLVILPLDFLVGSIWDEEDEEVEECSIYPDINICVYFIYLFLYHKIFLIYKFFLNFFIIF